MISDGNKFNIFSLRNRYIPAILIIAIFSFFSYFNVKAIMGSIKEDGSIINLSGKQRMLSQRLVLLAENYFYNPTSYNKEEVLLNIEMIEDSHKFLKEYAVTKELKTIYFEVGLDDELEAFTSLIHQLLLSKNDDYNQSEYETVMKKLRAKSQLLLSQFDKAVKEYEGINEEKLRELQNRQFFILVTIIVILLLEAIFIFYPASERMKENTQFLEDAVYDKTKELQKSIDIISEHVIYSQTDLKGTITYASKAFSDVSGFDNEELVGKPHNVVRHPDMPKSAFIDMWNTIKEGKRWRGEVKNLKKDGGYYWVDAFVSPEYDSRGNLVGYAAVRHNITLQKELEQRIKSELEKNRLKDQRLHEQTKMLQMSELLGNIAHHWRQPLSAISTASSGLILKKEVNILSDEEFSDTMNKIMAITQDLSHTIDDFTEFVNIDKKPVRFELQEKSHDTFDLVSKNFSSHYIKVILDFKKEPIYVMGVPSLLSQAVLNILTNAKEAVIDKHIKYPKVVFSIKKEDDNAVISVKDNAGGIDESMINKIFEPYVTTKHQSQGTGMGLHYSYKLITHEFKGTLTVKNGDEGAEFTITLPLHQEDTPT